MEPRGQSALPHSWAELLDKTITSALVRVLLGGRSAEHVFPSHLTSRRLPSEGRRQVRQGPAAFIRGDCCRDAGCQNKHRRSNLAQHHKNTVASGWADFIKSTSRFEGAAFSCPPTGRHATRRVFISVHAATEAALKCSKGLWLWLQGQKVMDGPQDHEQRGLWRAKHKHPRHDICFPLGGFQNQNNARLTNCTSK